jgi:predicted nucleotidyltransferase
MIINDLINKNILKPGSNIPKWLNSNVHYLTIMGSQAYAVSSDNSDTDVYGFAIPPKEMTFPHLGGHIQGFGPDPQGFEQWQQHHLETHRTTYDFSVYSIVKYFSLLAENNPNMIDSLFTPRRCILHCTEVGNVVRENRKNFLHKGAVNKFRGYAYSQMHKIRTKVNPENEKRQESVANYGYDVKFAYHVVRLVLECEQILLTGDLDLERDNEVLKSIRRGEWSIEKLEEWFGEAEKRLDGLSAASKLQNKPDYPKLRKLLLECLESHYGTISSYVTVAGSSESLVKELKDIISRYEK